MGLVFWRSNLEICWISYLMGIKSDLWLYKKKNDMKSTIIFLENNLQPRMLMLKFHFHIFKFLLNWESILKLLDIRITLLVTCRYDNSETFHDDYSINITL